jgi:hypothetical protein
MTTTTPISITDLTAALTAQGWTYLREVYTDAHQHNEIHELGSPDGRLRLDASIHPDGFVIARLSADAVRTDPGRSPGWVADLHEVPLPVALAAVKAAADSSPNSHRIHLAVTAALVAHGWEQDADTTERGRLVERTWESPDSPRTVVWNPADDFDEGGWTIYRDGPEDGKTNISQYTPAAVITALALTNHPDDYTDHPVPNTAPKTSRS